MSLKRIIAGIFLVLVAKSESLRAAGVAVETPTLWRELDRACSEGWASYEKFLRTTRTVLQKEYGTISREEYEKRDESEDPKLIFMSVTWPSDLAAQDEFWESYQDCAGIHHELRQKFATAASARSERLAEIGRLKDCARVRYHSEKLIEPLPRLVSCYEKLAVK